MSIDSEFDRLMAMELDHDRKHDAQMSILLAHMRMANQQLSQYAVFMRERDKRIEALEVGLQANTAITSEVRDMLNTGKTLFRVAGWIGSGAKWLTACAAAVGVLWGVIVVLRGGAKP